MKLMPLFTEAPLIAKMFNWQGGLFFEINVHPLNNVQISCLGP